MGKDETESENIGINKPFDPTKIKVETKQMSLDTLIKRMKEGEIDLSPDFQRNEVWKQESKSRLIESLLIRIPLPAFYMDATNEDKWVVVDGLQRLSTLRDFIITEDDKNRIILSDLEFLVDLNNTGFKDLPRNYQRRIEETQVTVYLIEKGTPSNVKFNIFKRINTGGLPLSAQEIRHALNQGAVTNLLKELAQSPEFQEATAHGIRDQRMSDRECILRFFAFVLTPYSSYNSTKDFDSFLSEAMELMNDMSAQNLENYKKRFLRAMKNASAIFSNKAFRKQTRQKSGGYPINKALFESWSVNLDKLTDQELSYLEKNKDKIHEAFITLMEDQEFVNAVTQGTGSSTRVQKRFESIERLIANILQQG
ncbi:MAG: DUF262 domain-containing protein [Magnetococcus sp. DMHC-6]